MSTYANCEEFHDDFIYDFYSMIEIIGKGLLRISFIDKHFHIQWWIMSREITNYQELLNDSENTEQKFKDEIYLLQ